MGIIEKQDLDLINDIKHGVNTDFNLKEIINRHSGVFVDAVKMFGGSLPSKDACEFIEEKDYHIYKAALNYDESRNAKFSTYLFYSAKWSCLSKKVKNAREVETVSFQEIFKDSSEQENFEFKIEPKSTPPSPSKRFVEKIEEKDILDSVFDLVSKNPDPRVEKIFTLRYKEGKKNKVMPWKNVAEGVGNLTAQRCIDIHNNTLEFLRNKIVKYE